MFFEKDRLSKLCFLIHTYYPELIKKIIRNYTNLNLSYMKLLFKIIYDLQYHKKIHANINTKSKLKRFT